MKKIKSIVFITLLVMTYASSNGQTDSSLQNSMQELFIALPDSIFTNFFPYGIQFNKEFRTKLIKDGADFPDSLIYRTGKIHYYFSNQEPSLIDLVCLDQKNKHYSLTISNDGAFGIRSRFYIYFFHKNKLEDRTEEILPKITLADFITPKYLDKFSNDFINRPTLSYKYLNDNTDTLKVKFEIIDHPFFYQDHPDFQIKNSIYSVPQGETVITKEEICLVWKKKKFVKIK